VHRLALVATLDLGPDAELIAEARGITMFRASVLADNPRMLDMIARFGDIRRRTMEYGVVELLFTARPTP
jgi:hypothetical protein